MEFIIKLAALIAGAHMMQDPKPCGCGSYEQYYELTDANPTVIHVVDYTKKKCKLDLQTKIVIASDNDDIFDQFIVSEYSSRRGLLSKQVINGSTFEIKSNIVVQKKEAIYYEVQAVKASPYVLSVTFEQASQ